MLSLRRSLPLVMALALLLPAQHGGVQAKPLRNQPVPLPNGYSRFVGEPFFLLSDATFGAAETAKVRVEVNNPEALRDVGGLDVVLYRVPDPLAFLQTQKNLHRVQFEGQPAAEGLANALTHIWDNWAVKARLSWRQLFSPEARRAVTEQAPNLKTPATLTKPSTFTQSPQFKPLPGLQLVERFRYPLPWAKPIQPPKDLQLAGSSSEFITAPKGNVMVPLGQRAPGLYVVEAISGQHRATTLLFVSDTVAITKVSGDQMLVWAAQRSNGAAVPATKVVWSDGVGVLKSGEADGRGLVRLDRAAPEQTYLFGADPKGGVFISENFYYDSEIYAAKVYATTDRPLYRPGDAVQFKLTGREFKNARESVPLKDGEVSLTVLDPAGQPVHNQNLRFVGAKGGDGRFQLPDNASAGGYEMRFAFGNDSYTAAFRVADYQKPHFEVTVLPDKPDFGTGQAVTGKLQLNYPDGKPVAGASVSLTARAQQLTMVDGELDYAGQFPLKLSQQELKTDSKGVASFSLPAADQPSRYVLTALATDGAAYRVRASKELLIDRAASAYKLSASAQFSKPAETVNFNYGLSSRNTSGTAEPSKPTQWEWLRLEDRSKASGKLADGNTVALSFPKPGSYTLTLRDDKNRIVGATSHWVSGEGAKAPVGSIGMVFNRANYKAGDTAELLVSFPEPIDHALLTLERERVENTALLGQATDWVKSERLNPTQWKLTLPVRETMSPNVTVSVAYVKNGDYVFQNQGLMVEQPKVQVLIKSDKPVYQPGETVTVDVSTTLAGKPVAADVAVGVVDEMIYVLQPEIAPSIEDFYFHPRRNNVRTSASLSFIGYDLATSKLGTLPARRQVNERALKVLERPRRDNIDTAAWQPSLSTDASGRTRFSFTMPDSLTRWRLTARAMTVDGAVGQQTNWLRSDKPFYAKWTSPTWQRDGDKPQASVALFNQTGKDAQVEWEAQWQPQGAGPAAKNSISLRPGINFIALPTASDKADPPRHGAVTFTLRQDGRVVDQLSTALQRLPVAWRGPREVLIDMANPAELKLPPDATGLRVSFASDPAAGRFNRWMDELIDYPYGCVEQTASRMLPLSLALQSLSPAQASLAPQLTQRLSTARLSLAQMAGPEARFGWWGRGMADDAFLTSYAYYADWLATRALRSTLPPEHWQRLLEVYRKGGAELPPAQRALALHWMQEMGLPVGSMANELVNDLAKEGVKAEPASAPAPAASSPGAPAAMGSLVMTDETNATARDIALVLALHVAAKSSPSAEARSAADAAAARLAPLAQPFVQALLIATRRADAAKASALLSQAASDGPTLDRAQTLVWLHGAMGRRPDAANARADAPTLPAPWRRSTAPNGDPQWLWPAGQALPSSLTLAPTTRAAWAYASFESAVSEGPVLPLRVERQLFKVIVGAPEPAFQAAEAPASGPAPDPVPNPSAGRSDITLEPVKPGTALDTTALYLDQVTLTAPRKMRWVLAEVPLPPGASVESSTWGLSLSDGKGASEALERARHQPTAHGYAVPFDALEGDQATVARHLVRFSQRGSFKLPPTRAHRMYDPDAKAHDSTGRWANMDVR